LAPLFLVAGFLVVLLGVLAVALMLVVSLVALITLAIVGLWSPRARSTRGTIVQITRRQP
jgi:hypothetical protein